MKKTRFFNILSQSQKSLLLTATSLYILSSIFFLSNLRGEIGRYVYVNEYGEEIHLPKRPIISMANPGGHFQAVSSHKPQVEITTRNEGLELIRVLNFHFPELPNPLGKDSLDAIYILDKDGLIVGHTILKSDQQDAKISINSVINYVTIYVECTKHGFWSEELSIPL